ncbi:MAG TPA: FtsX-like permease family protein, partial [Pyrinomonadaceae bacterium]
SLNNIYPSTGTPLYPAPSPTQMADTPQPVRFTNIRNIMAAATTTPEIPVAMKQIGEVLRERHRLREGEPDDFQVRDMTEINDMVGESTKLVGTLLIIVAAISLAVGGVGIMNIMLVSVTERTKEIGIRKAVGARRKDILTQFLIEAVMVTAIGGAFGVLTGFGTAWLIALAIGFPLLFSIWSAVLGVGVSSIVGVISGLWPAWRAARLDPIDALRAE